MLDHVGEWKPNVIVHLAYRRDDAASIVAASANVAEAAAARRARLVHLSSDVVFVGRELPDVRDGSAGRGDGLRAVEGRGRAARALAVCRNVVLVRTSLLYGTARLAPWQRAIRDRQPVTWFTDEIRCPTHAADVAHAICVLARRADVRGPVHAAAPEAVSRAGLAQAMAGWMHLGDGAVRTGGGAPHDRPGRLVLDSARAAPSASTAARWPPPCADPRGPGQHANEPSLHPLTRTATVGSPVGHPAACGTCGLRPARRDVADDQADAGGIGSQLTSPPTSTTSSSIRCSVEPMVNSRTGPPSSPLAISRPAAPAEKSPLIGLTPLCRPCTDCTEDPVVDVGDERRLVAVRGRAAA